MRFGQMILYMNYDRVFNLQSWNAGKSKINYRYNYGFYELFTSRAFSWHFSIWLGHWIFQVNFFKKRAGFGLDHSPKAVFWLAQFQLSDFSSYFSELGCSIVLTNHNFDTFLLWEIFFQWFWHFRLKFKLFFSEKNYGSLLG